MQANFKFSSTNLPQMDIIKKYTFLEWLKNFRVGNYQDAYENDSSTITTILNCTTSDKRWIFTSVGTKQATPSPLTQTEGICSFPANLTSFVLH